MAARPDVAMGYAACEAALQGNPIQEGNVGAEARGCTIGKIRGPQYAMKGGLGTCAYRQGDLMVGAVMACNAMGDVVEDGTILAGARNDDNTGFAGTEEWLIQHGQRQRDIFSGKLVGENTVIGCGDQCRPEQGPGRQIGSGGAKRHCPGGSSGQRDL